MKLSVDQNINMEKKVINKYKARMNYTHGKLPLIKRVAIFLGKNFKKNMFMLLWLLTIVKQELKLEVTVCWEKFQKITYHMGFWNHFENEFFTTV